MLKWSSEDEVNTFCAKTCSFFNPKFTGTTAEQDAQSEIAFATVYDFAKKCELTADEFSLGLRLATEGKLKTELDKDGNAEIIKLFREIDIIKLGEVKAAYIRFKMDDEKYRKGKAEINLFLNPPPAELTDDQKKEIRLKFLKEDFARLKSKGAVLGSTTFYDLIRKENKIIKIAFVEKFMLTFKPEVFEDDKRSLEIHLASTKKIIKKDVFLSFKELFVAEYIEKMKLKDVTEEEWIEHWEKFRSNEKPDRDLSEKQD